MNTLDKLYKKAKQISKDNGPYICMLHYNYDINKYTTEICYNNVEMNFSKEWETVEQAKHYVKNCIEQQYKECIILNIGGV